MSGLDDLRTVTSRAGVATNPISWYAWFSSAVGDMTTNTPNTYEP
jgi:hypothetical protein